MKTLDHIKLAGFTGLVVGILFGTIDIIARIIRLWFEWFEFYQTLLIHSVLFTLGFVIISLFIELFRKVIKSNITKKTLSVFYVASALSLILLFYGEIFVNYYLPSNIPFSDMSPLFYILAVIFVVGLIYILLLTKGKRLVLRIISFYKKKDIKKFIKNYIFILILFIIISFFIDLYSLTNIPYSVVGEELEGYPNILLITLDSLRPDHISFYNYPLNTTPNIDNLAKDSVVFENAISSGSWTLPAMSSIFIGKYPSRHNATYRYQKLGDKEITLAEILRERGYNTAGFIGCPYTKTKFGVSQGFKTYKDRLDFFEYHLTFDRFDIRNMIYFLSPNLHKFIFNADGEITVEEINKDVFKWLDKNKNQQPLFLFLMYFDAHDPYNLGTEFREEFTNETRDYNEVNRVLQNENRYENVSAGTVRYVTALYDTEIFYLDYHLEKLFNKLDELGLKNNTIIIITADHAEEFNEHGSFIHGLTLYDEVIHVPLIIYYPKEFKAQKIEKRIGTIDIFSTILDTLQIDIPDNIDSVSLLPLIKKDTEYKGKYVFSEIYRRDIKQQAISVGDWKLIEVHPEIETIPSSLFNLRNDPKEQKNLYNTHIEKRKLLQKYIVDLIGDVQED